MKKLFIDWIWQWVNDDWIGFNPIGLELEYDKSEPSLGFKFVILGIGIDILWIVPWETQKSKEVKESLKSIHDFFSVGGEFLHEFSKNQSKELEK